MGWGKGIISFKKLTRGSILFSIVLVGSVVGRVAHSFDFKPSWKGIYSNDSDSNQSFLTSTCQLPVQKMELLDRSQALALGQRLNDLNRDYEMRRKFGLIPPELEMSHTGQLTEFSRNVVQEVQNRQLEIEKRKVMPLVNKLRKSEVVKAVEKPAGVVAGVVALYFGAPIDLNLSEHTKISARTVVPAGTARLALNSEFLDGAFDFITTAPLGRDPASPPPVDPIGRGDERYRASITREIPWIGAMGGISYLGTTGLVGTSFSKQITPHLSCALDYYYPLDPLNSDVKAAGENVRVYYGMNF